MRPLGKHQRDMLAALGCPDWYMVVGTPVLRSLAKRGLVKAHGDDSFYAITPAGLRALADELEAGRVKQEAV